MVFYCHKRLLGDQRMRFFILMPEYSFGSSFEKVANVGRVDKKPQRPTSQKIAETAQFYLEDPKTRLRPDGAIQDFRYWSNPTYEGPSDLVKIRAEAYPGWTSEDFGTLVALLEEGSRPDEKTMSKRMDSIFNELRQEGWTQDDFLRAMESFKRGSDK